MTTVTQEEAIANLPRLIDAAKRGDEIFVTRDRIAVARILPFTGTGASSALESSAPRLSITERLALLRQKPPIYEDGPSLTDESLRRENLYDDRA